MKLQLTFFPDDSHGWLRVPKASVPKRSLAKISSCSYMDDEYLYLEEDRDAGICLNALKEEGVNVEVDIAAQARRSGIRDLAPFFFSDGLGGELP